MTLRTDCDFCRTSTLVPLYAVPESKRGMKVMMCSRCSLVHSVQTKTAGGKRAVRISSDADWGNIRIGKTIAFERHRQILEQSIPWERMRTVLDVGASRGTFIVWVHTRHPRIAVAAIEPDATVTGDYEKSRWVTLYQKRFEDVSLPHESFDLVYCCHTLEHVASARETLLSMHRLLKTGGYLVLDVPNIDVIGDDDVVEEFFIDKHTFHFSRGLLMDYLKHMGFAIVNGSNDTDRSNIVVIAKKVRPANDRIVIAKRGNDVARMKRLIDGYKTTLSANRKTMKKIGRMLNAFMERQRVVFWGGGRIFDALVTYGGLDPSKSAGLIDTYLAGTVKDVHGVAVSDPYILRMTNPHVVIVLAKSSQREIIARIRRFGIINIISFRTLLQNIDNCSIVS